MKLTHLAHQIWKKYVHKGATCIDATCGNGHDTLFLAQEILTPTAGKLIALDIQEQALAHTKTLLQKHLPTTLLQRVFIEKRSHVDLPQTLPAPTLICYNLGYLPGSDKTIETLVSTTLRSLETAADLLDEGGLISIVCYIGHATGKKEYKALVQWQQTLSKSFTVFEIKRSNALDAPILFLLEKKIAARSHEIKTTCNEQGSVAL